MPLKKQLIQDKTRIDLSIPFIQNLLNRNAKVMLVSHLGRPKNDLDRGLSLKPVFEYLKERLETKFIFTPKK